ncbi:Inosine-uridine nucleoside N-ribohydrolase [Dyadobacter soli]|uniref:Inosine-uridine nucleoside N-ribohydrolase n=1 Tax=Dyadobacter soli TaxID=659014 RepID=A0A1G7MPF9_9BACT|nr:nucleoside hydrolase [Dyadobacter soli]SDF63623.1 Inosine-uridine nucleoside N-ribohydrolase [Dyadobacter soli]
MSWIRLLRFIFLSVFWGFRQVNAQTPKLPAVAVILDTDMDSDVDDVGALAMLHAYEKQRMARILGIIVTSDDQYSAPCTDAINRWFGHNDIPIGVSQRDSLRSFSKYTRQISERFASGFNTNADGEDGTAVYRKLLAREPDSSVVIITIGHLTSLARLLTSGPDSISPLSGSALVKTKVKHWSCMGGQFPEGKEANFYRPDPASTIFCLSNWKLPVTFAGWEIGSQVVTGGQTFKSNSSTDSPIYQAYQLYNDFKGRASWDQLAILKAIEGVQPYFKANHDGTCQVAADGSNRWVSPSNGLHAYLSLHAPADKIRERIDSLMSGSANGAK